MIVLGEDEGFALKLLALRRLLLLLALCRDPAGLLFLTLEAGQEEAAAPVLAVAEG